MIQTLRFERKFLLPLEEYARIRGRVDKLLSKDVHTGREGYSVRSLYFDTFSDGDYFEKLDGVEARRKLRLRLYHPSDDFAFLEMKQKQGEHQRKRSLRLGRPEAQALAQGDYSPLLSFSEPFAGECYALLNLRGYRPRAVVEYQREAYTVPGSDTRLTFDRDLRATESRLDLFDPDLNLYPVMNLGQVVFEVKYTGFLAEYVRELVDACQQVQTSASKYCMGRLASYGVI